MGKLVVTEFVTLDGVFQDPGGTGEFDRGGWAFQFDQGDDGAKFKFDELLASDAQLLGRVTYEGFAKAWPTMEGTGEFGEKMNAMPKFVVSTTLKDLDWSNSTLIKKNVASELAKLKQESGGDLIVFGSMSLVNKLIQKDLIDEYRLLVYPVVLGAGKRLFDERSQTKVLLKLTATKSLGSDVALLTYTRAGV